MSNKSLWDYILSKNHIIPSPLGNKLGIPVLRTILANLIIKFRRLKNCKPNNVYENKLIEENKFLTDNLLQTQQKLLQAEEKMRHLEEEIQSSKSQKQSKSIKDYFGKK